MSEFFSKRASGTSEIDVWMQEVEAALNSLRPINVPGVITYDFRPGIGWVANVKPGKAAGGAVADENFRGEWLSSALYARGNRVVISLGANRGTYEYVTYAPSSGHEPWLGGGYWFKTSDSLGQWM